MGKIFISYRRADSAYQAVMLYQELVKAFGKEAIFKDVDTIPLGVNFKTHLQKQVEKCQILLAVIGKDWLDIRDKQGERRLDDPLDFVRIEIASALSREIPVIPVLVGGQIPHEGELPDELKELAYRNGLEIRADPDFFGDINRLIRGIQKLLEESVGARSPGGQVVEPTPSAPPQFSGFRHLRQATHSCGGQTHTVEEYIHEKTGMEFVLVPAGSFEMGSRKWSNSKPIHTVRLKPFLMGKYQVTQKVWQKIMGSTPSYFKGDDRPVEQVSWHDCKKFCKKVGLSLPSEAQWEYACRAGTVTKYYWGDDFGEMDQYGWWDGNSGGKTHPVGERDPNAYGLFDMAGNVWEWMEDNYESGYNSAPDDGSPRLNKGTGKKAVRGGSWCYLSGYFFASAYRYLYTPDYQYLYLGFRVVACS